MNSKSPIKRLCDIPLEDALYVLQGILTDTIPPRTKHNWVLHILGLTLSVIDWTWFTDLMNGYPYINWAPRPLHSM